MKKITLFLMASFLGLLGFSQVKMPTTFTLPEVPMKLTSQSDVHFFKGDEIRQHLSRAYGDTLYYFDMKDSVPTGWFAHDNTGHGYVFYWDTVGPIGAYTHVTGSSWDNPLPALSSVTGKNGFLKFPADAYNTDSSSGKIKTDYVTHDSYIQAPAMSFDSMACVILRFQERFRLCCTYSGADLYVEVSNDSTNWTQYKVASPYANINEQSSADSSYTLVEINIAKVAANQSKVWVRWHISGLSHYYWMFDDVEFIEGPKNDIIFSYYFPQFSGADYWYRMLPMKQTTPVTMWKSTVVNNGSNTAAGIKLNVSVTDENATTVHSFSYDTLMLNGASDTIAPFASDTIEPPATMTYAFFPDTTALHQYTFNASLSMDSTDEEAGNDKAQIQYLDITDTVMARAIVNTTFVGIGGWTNSVTGDIIGTSFYLPNEDTVGSVTFYISTSTDTEDVSFDISLSVYDGSAWVNDVITSADPVPVTGDMLGKWVTVPFDYNTFDRTIEGGTSVIVGVKQYYDLANQTFRIGANSAYPREKGNGGVLWSGNDATWYWISEIPTIRLNFHRSPVGIHEITVSDSPISVYPNPTNAQLHIDGVVEGSTIAVYNMLGAEVAHINNANAFNTMSVASLPAGTYIVKIINDNKVVTRKVTTVK
jgi:hypothetical protein